MEQKLYLKTVYYIYCIWKDIYWWCSKFTFFTIMIVYSDNSVPL